MDSQLNTVKYHLFARIEFLKRVTEKKFIDFGVCAKNHLAMSLSIPALLFWGKSDTCSLSIFNTTVTLELILRLQKGTTSILQGRAWMQPCSKGEKKRLSLVDTSA